MALGYSAQDLHDKFWGTVINELVGANLGITYSCLQILDGFINNGVANMLTTTASFQDMAQATQNLQQFVQVMAGEARAHQWMELHEDTFYFAQPKLCPLFPFC